MSYWNFYDTQVQIKMLKRLLNRNTTQHMSKKLSLTLFTFFYSSQLFMRMTECPCANVIKGRVVCVARGRGNGNERLKTGAET